MGRAMANYDRNVRAESWGWLIAAVLVGVLAMYGAWSDARLHDRLTSEIPLAAQTAPQ